MPPPEAAIVIRYVPGVVEVGLHFPVTAVVPVTVRLAGQPGVMPVAGVVEVVRVIVPVNPPDGVMVTVELPVALRALTEAPVLKSAGEVAVIVKFPPVNVKTAGAVWDAVPGEPLPVIVTVNVPELVEVQVRLDEPVPFAVNGTLVAVNAVHVRPGVVLLVRLMVPTKLNVLVRVIVDVSDAPGVPLCGEALIEKSPT